MYEISMSCSYVKIVFKELLLRSKNNKNKALEENVAKDVTIRLFSERCVSTTCQIDNFRPAVFTYCCRYQ